MPATFEQAILDIEHAETVAVIYDPRTEEKHDEAFNWETGQTYAQMNYKVIAVRDDISRFTNKPRMTVEEAQMFYDYERALVQDCFGITDKDLIDG